jgi:3D (Asp-Asp-Asp) domain-containing protein
MLETSYFTPRVTLSFCLLLLLSAGIQAQSRSTPSSPSAKTPGALPVITDHPTINHLLSLSDHLPHASDGSNGALPEITFDGPPPLAALNISLMHPRLDREIQPRAERLDALAFAAPELESEDAPRVFEATAYCLRGITASGTYVRPGVIAADPRVLPLGTVVRVKAGDYSGIYTVQDTGRRVKGRIVDIWMASKRAALNFGRRAVKLQVLSYGPRRHSAKR